MSSIGKVSNIVSRLWSRQPAASGGVSSASQQASRGTKEKSKTGLIGYPVSHSLSPLIHSYWMKEYGISGEYKAYEILPENLEKEFRNLEKSGLKGFNVTIPHKEAILDLVDETDEVSKKAGAVNTVLFTGDKYKGFNTDVYGFRKSLENKGFTSKSGSAVVLGAGGASRAIVLALMEIGISKIFLTNRTTEKSEKIKSDIGENIIPTKWDDRNNVLKEASLLVNATSLGLKGKGEVEIDFTRLPNGATVTDIVYNPIETEFLKAARAHGFKTIDGLWMLLFQAAKAFEIWHGVAPEPSEDLWQKCAENLIE